MNIAIVGLGLIGGSLAKAFKETGEHKIFGADKDKSVVLKAKLTEAIDESLTDENIGQCDIVIIAIYPHDTVNYVIENAPRFKKGALVFDTCGVKQAVCNPIWEACSDYDFTFVGGHPMAGREFSGFNYSKKNLFTGASMILVPRDCTDITFLESIKKIWVSIGFARIQITTPDEHDRIIAFTSQLAHVVSSAYIKSPTATQHKGFSAGSYKDMTRVAKLNETMWTELFLSNKKALTQEIDDLIKRLSEYSNAIKSGDDKTLSTLLREGREAKALAEKRGQ
ncbi:MAG: prephenate dehydrogenase [Ruminococcaceae bacterium]|nr:prephenate dehydrogenase [Oscillospiraceae bacterium]